MSPASGSVPVHAPPRGLARHLASAFIAAWLLWQVAVPALYHVALDASDERFAWRMFSDVWWYHKTCQVSLVEVLDGAGPAEPPGRRLVILDRAFHQVWLRQLQRMRRAVVEKALHRRCEADAAVTEVVFTRTCPAAPPSRLPPVRVKLSCRTGIIEESAPSAVPGSRP